MMARVAAIVPDTEAEGPGRRFALWFQGCPLRCPGCCNPEFLSFDGGRTIAVETIIDQIKNTPSVEGISLLGGEPFAHLDAAIAIATAVRESDLSVMIYSGYTLRELRDRNDEQVNQLLDLTDLLVDGRYERDQPETKRRWIGSANQQVHFLSTLYSPEDPCWTKPNTIEIRMIGNDVTVNGFPAANAKPLWKGWRRPVRNG